MSVATHSATSSFILTDFPFDILTRIVAHVSDAPSCDVSNDPHQVVCNHQQWAHLNSLRASNRVLRDVCRHVVVGLKGTVISSEDVNVENTNDCPESHFGINASASVHYMPLATALSLSRLLYLEYVGGSSAILRCARHLRSLHISTVRESDVPLTRSSICGPWIDKLESLAFNRTRERTMQLFLSLPFSRLKKLVFGYMTDLRRPLATHIVDQLEEIEIFYGVCDSVLEQLSHAPSLRSLKFSGCIRITSQTFTNFGCFPRLAQLHLDFIFGTGCGAFQRRLVEGLQKGAFRQLRDLTLRFYEEEQIAEVLKALVFQKTPLNRLHVIYEARRFRSTIRWGSFPAFKSFPTEPQVTLSIDGPPRIRIENYGEVTNDGISTSRPRFDCASLSRGAAGVQSLTFSNVAVLGIDDFCPPPSLDFVTFHKCVLGQREMVGFLDNSKTLKAITLQHCRFFNSHLEGINVSQKGFCMEGSAKEVSTWLSDISEKITLDIARKRFRWATNL